VVIQFKKNDTVKFGFDAKYDGLNGLACTKINTLMTGSFKLFKRPFLVFNNFNPLNAELNPICYLLALLAHHFLHVSRIRVKSLTLRLLMSYIQGVPGGMCQISGGCSLC